jgi:hypothetical protein
MSIVDQVLSEHQQNVAALRARYVEIIRRGDHPEPGDARELASLMDALGVTADQARADLAVIEEVRRLEALADEAEGERLASEVSAAAGAFLAYSEETKRIVREREAEGFRLHGLVITARMKRQRWQEHNALLLQLRRQHFALLGLDPPTPRSPDPRPWQGAPADNPNRT